MNNQPISSDPFCPFNKSFGLCDHTVGDTSVSVYNLMDYCYMGLVDRNDQEYVASIGAVRRPSMDMCIINQYYSKRSVSDEDLKSNRFLPTEVDRITGSLLKRKDERTVTSLLEKLFFVKKLNDAQFFIEENECSRKLSECNSYEPLDIPHLPKEYVEFCKDRNLIIKDNQSGSTLVLNPFIPFTSAFAVDKPLNVHIYCGMLRSTFPNHSDKSIFDYEVMSRQRYYQARSDCIFEILTQRAAVGVKQLVDTTYGRNLLSQSGILEWVTLPTQTQSVNRSDILCDYNLLGEFIYNKLNQSRESILDENMCFDWLESQMVRSTRIFEHVRSIRVAEAAEGKDETFSLCTAFQQSRGMECSPVPFNHPSSREGRSPGISIVHSPNPNRSPAPTFNYPSSRDVRSPASFNYPPSRDISGRTTPRERTFGDSDNGGVEQHKRRNSFKSFDNTLFPYFYKPISPCKDLVITTTIHPLDERRLGGTQYIRPTVTRGTSGPSEDIFTDNDIKEICSSIYPNLRSQFMDSTRNSTTLYSNFINFRKNYCRYKYNTMILIVLCANLTTSEGGIKSTKDTCPEGGGIFFSPSENLTVNLGNKPIHLRVCSPPLEVPSNLIGLGPINEQPEPLVVNLHY